MIRKRKICVVTGTRAEYGILYWLMKDISSDPLLLFQLVVAASHFSAKFGSTYKDIEADGFEITESVELPLDHDDSAIGICRAIGEAVHRFSVVFDRLKPDIVVLLGDRYEIFAAASAATIHGFPIAHIHGGECTSGAFDESFRHAITKMACFHFTAADHYRKCVIQMGEDPRRVFCVGAPALDHLKRSRLLSRGELEEILGLALRSPLFLVTFHPVTREKKTSSSHVRTLLEALDSFPQATIVFTGSNADPDNFVIREYTETYAKSHPDRMCFIVSLGHLKYLSLLKHADLVIGNSSSGITEAPAFGKATVNIGDRQKGRLMADSIICCLEEADAIRNAIVKAMSREFQHNAKNPYGSCDASIRIKNILKDVPLTKHILKKEFYYL